MALWVAKKQLTPGRRGKSRMSSSNNRVRISADHRRPIDAEKAAWALIQLAMVLAKEAKAEQAVAEARPLRTAGETHDE
jgi:hypothetical protein